MALTQSDLERLDSAIAASELEVEVDGQRIRYRDTDSLIRARAHVASVLSGSASGNGGTSRSAYYPTFVLRREL